MLVEIIFSRMDPIIIDAYDDGRVRQWKEKEYCALYQG
jgi:hypothetical protein